MEIHFLNVREGDCSIIEHDSGRVSMIDICCGNLTEEKEALKESARITLDSMVFGSPKGDFKQRLHPVNPIAWLDAELSRKKNLNFFRFISTHPDMDHLDGIEALFKKHSPSVFWDTDNSEEKDVDFGRYRKEDWLFYQKLHASGDKSGDVRILRLHAGAKNCFYNRDDGNGNGEGDRISILSPSAKTQLEAEENNSVNDLSYVLLVKSAAERKFVFAGDSEESAWNILLPKYEDELRNVDVLFAPHHGRTSGGNDDYLDILKPKVTFFGNAKSQNLDDDTFNRKGLLKFSNNQLGSVALTEEDGRIHLWGTNKSFVDKWRSENKQSARPVCLQRGGSELHLLKEI